MSKDKHDHDHDKKTRTVVIVTNNEWANAQPIARNPAWVVIEGAEYVWNSLDLNAASAVISRTFSLPKKRIRNATLRLSLDNYGSVLINGAFVVNDLAQDNPPFYNPGRTFDVRPFLRNGANDIVIAGFNFGGTSTPTNPAGIAARLEIELDKHKD